MRNLLASLALLAIVLGVGLYAAGWVKYYRGEHDATIQIKTGEIEDAAERATEQGRELIEEVIEQPVYELDPASEKPHSKSELKEPVT